MADEFKACSVDDCKRNAHWRAKGARGWCLAHYKKYRKYGDPLKSAGRIDNSGKCLIDGCDNKSKSIGLCNSHYLRLKTTGAVNGTGKAFRGEPAAFFSEALLYDGDGCLTWPFSRNASGYGTIFAPKGDDTIVSRKICRAIHGDPPNENYHAAHSCGNGHLGCVAPKHLSWKLPAENSEDKKQHGTFWNKSRGSNHRSSKLTENQVREIRANQGFQTADDAAKQYFVTRGAIVAIYQRKTWKHLE